MTNPLIKHVLTPARPYEQRRRGVTYCAGCAYAPIASMKCLSAGSACMSPLSIWVVVPAGFDDVEARDE